MLQVYEAKHPGIPTILARSANALRGCEVCTLEGRAIARNEVLGCKSFKFLRIWVVLKGLEFGNHNPDDDPTIGCWFALALHSASHLHHQQLGDNLISRAHHNCLCINVIIDWMKAKGEKQVSFPTGWLKDTELDGQGNPFTTGFKRWKLILRELRRRVGFKE